MLLAVNVFLTVICSVMDEIAIMVILGPLLIVLANRFGVDPIHFGAIIVTNVAIGMAAPPMAIACSSAWRSPACRWLRCRAPSGPWCC